ncbi:MAG TPA: tetratricopeptide repeat protein [Thermoanaerobaculia bacterium]|jgi:arylsulfatase A-like enzyme
MGSKKKNGSAAARDVKPIPAATPPPAPPKRSRRWLVVAALAAAIVVAAGIAFTLHRRGGGDGGAPTDIILVTIDTLRYDCVGFTGHSPVKTPYLDELARGGIWFENAHSHNVVTFPSHTNILTGLLPYQHGVRDNAGFTLDPKHKTVAYYLKQAGYATGGFVSAYPLDERFGLAPDFDAYDDKYPEGTAPSAFVVPERPSSETLAAAQQWWDANDGKKRFMWVHLYEPHAPYEPRSPFKEQYPSEPYFGEIASADDYLAHFLAPILDKKPDTLVIVTADHGEGRGEHGEVTHGLFAYEETLHIPLIVYDRQRIKPRVEKNFVRHIDIVPTILARAGVEKPKELLGASLLDVKEPRDTYFESLTASLNLGWAPLVGLIHEGNKYVDLPIAELYNLPRDPLEKKNILTEDRRTTTRLRALLASAAPNPTAANANRNISETEAQNLRSLGYLTGTAAAKKTYTADDDPKNLVEFYARMHRAEALYQKGQWNEAIAVAQQLLKERPEMTMAKDLLAFVLSQTEQTGKAEAVLRDAVAKGTASDTMKKRLGLLLSEQGDAAEAVQILSQFANAKDPDLLNAYGIALADLGRVQEAVQQFEHALQIDHTNATAFQNLGVVALRVGDLPRAQQYLNRAVQLNDKMPLALNSLGVLYARQGDYPRAVAAWQRAVTIDPRQYDALFNLGLVAGKSGNLPVARAALTQFVKTAPPQRYASDISKAKQALSALR